MAVTDRKQASDEPEPTRYSAVTFAVPVRIARHACASLPRNDGGNGKYVLELQGPFLRVTVEAPGVGIVTKLVPLSNVVDLTPWTEPKPAR